MCTTSVDARPTRRWKMGSRDGPKGRPCGENLFHRLLHSIDFLFSSSFILLGLVCMPFMDVWRWRSNSLSYSFHTGHRRVSSQLTESKNAPNERWFRKIRSLRCHIWIRSTLNIFSFSYSPSPSSFFFQFHPFSATAIQCKKVERTGGFHSRFFLNSFPIIAHLSYGVDSFFKIYFFFKSQSV